MLERCAEAGDKIVTVHSVRTVVTVLDMVETHLPRGRGQVVLHWFTGSRSEAKRATELGCFFSVNATMMDSERGRALVASMPLDRVLTETDGPFTQLAGALLSQPWSRPLSPGWRLFGRCRKRPSAKRL